MELRSGAVIYTSGFGDGDHQVPSKTVVATFCFLFCYVASLRLEMGAEEASPVASLSVKSGAVASVAQT